MNEKTTWLYQKTEPRLWTVGYYDPSGKWFPESDHNKESQAADRVHFLNGGINAELVAALKEISNPIAFMEKRLQPGEKLNGAIAVALSDSANHLKGIARAALAKAKYKPDDPKHPRWWR